MAGDAIKVLILEDFPADAELAAWEVKKHLPDCAFQVVAEKATFLGALSEFQPHVIISDYKMPSFDGMEALAVVRERCPLVPVIMLTGSMNEDTAVDCMKAGASDYVIKEHMKRLGPAVLSSLENARVAQEKVKAEAYVRLNEARLHCLFEISTREVADGDDLLDFILGQALSLTDSRLGFIMTYRAEAETFRLISWSASAMSECEVVEKPIYYRLSEAGLWGDVVRKRAPVLLNDYNVTHPSKKGVPQGHVQLTRVLGVPVFWHQSIVAAVWVANKETGYTGDDVFQLDTLMGQAWRVAERYFADSELKKTLREKDLLIRELHHRTRNNMQLILSMLSFQAALVDDERVRDHFRRIGDRIQTMALVQQMLMLSSDLSSVQMDQYIPFLADNTRLSYPRESAGLSIEFETEPISVLMDIAIPCGMIINELVSNAVRHAFPSGGRGRVFIAFKRLEDGRLSLCVRDDGVGMTTAGGADTGTGTGLGLQLVTQIAKNQLQGEVEFLEGPGFGCSVVFRETQYRSRICAV